MSDGVARSTFRPFDLLLIGALGSMWGFSFLFIKVAVRVFSPLWVVTLRTTVASVVLLLLMRVRGRQLPRERVMWGHLLVISIITNAVPWAMVAWSAQFLPSGLTSVLNTLVPASTLAVAVAIGQERMSLARVVGLGLATAGTAIAVSSQLGEPGKAIAVVLVVSATLLYGAGAVYAKQYVSGRIAPLSVATGQVVAAAALTLPVALVFSDFPSLPDIDASAAGSIAALGVFGTGLAFLVFYALIERVGATSATMVTYVIPVVALVAGWLVLGERLGWEVVAGTAVLGVGIWLAQRERPSTVPVEALERLGA